MEITLREISIRALTEGYADNQENGVVGYGGKLDIRPPYQREFIYNEKQRDAVITTVLRGFPLNVMYWADKGNGYYEVIDGQQRTVSICQYISGVFSYLTQDSGMQYFHNLPADVREQVLDYRLMVYVCKGTDSEKLDWFRIINIAGAKLTEQELRNAVYSGSWLSDAKRHFSKNGCPAQRIGGDYLNGSAIRQDYLETALNWLSRGAIEQYMADHQHDANANALWIYFKNVMDWVQMTFPKYRREMKGIDWGSLYDQFKEQVFDIAALEQEVSELMQDGEITNKRGIYLYVLDHNEQHLDLRMFDEKTKRKVYEQQRGRCAGCGEALDIAFMHGDHIVPWSKGGRTVIENCQMLCAKCNIRKGSKI